MASEADPAELKREESASPSHSANTGVTTPSPTQRVNDLLDDVFGSSEPASPVAGPTDIPTVNLEATAVADPASNSHPEHKESSDITRLRSIHSTSGYRDGLAIAREQKLQPGFDEGYSLGAALGLKAGLVVGSFESLCKAVQGPQNAKVNSQLESLTKRCIRDLSRSNLLSLEYLDINGIWKWDAPSDGTLDDVAVAHPVVKAWLLRLDAVLYRLGISADKLEIRWTEHAASDPQSTKAQKLPSPPSTQSQSQSSQTFDF